MMVIAIIAILIPIKINPINHVSEKISVKFMISIPAVNKIPIIM